MKWQVYEFVKKYHSQYYRLPSKIYLIQEFPKASREEIEEGLLEFQDVLNRETVTL